MLGVLFINDIFFLYYLEGFWKRWVQMKEGGDDVGVFSENQLPGNHKKK